MKRSGALASTAGLAVWLLAALAPAALADTVALHNVRLLDRDQPASPGDNNTVYVGRVTWLPYLSPNESTLLHLGLGLRHNEGDETVRARSRPETAIAPLFADTGPLVSERFTTALAELSLRTGPLWLHSKYNRTEVDAPDLGDPDLGDPDLGDPDLGDPELGDPTMGGYFLAASWFVTGEMRPYRKRLGSFGRPVPARDVNHNGPGAWELSARLSHLDLNDGAVQGGEMDILSAGVNWWLSPYLLLGLNYRYVDLDRLGEQGDSQSLTARVGIFLE